MNRETRRILIGGLMAMAAAGASHGLGRTALAQAQRSPVCHVPSGASEGRLLALPDAARQAHWNHGDPQEYVDNGDGTCAAVCVPGFDPRTVPALELWFNADRLAAMLADGERVAVWPDDSGHGRDAAQGNVARQPVFRTGLFNGHAAVDFDADDPADGNDDVLDLTGSSTILTRISMFIVYSYDTATMSGDTSRTYPFTLGGNVDVTGQYYGIETLNGAADGSTDVADIFAGFGNDARATFPGISAAGRLTVLSAITDTTIHNTVVHVNGTPAAMSFTGSDIALAVPVSGPAGASWSGIGGSSYPGDENSSDAKIAEVLVYSTALGDLQRRQIECYLKAKYAIP
jgi:hypothetical protein